MAESKDRNAAREIETLRGSPMSFGALLHSIRVTDEHTLQGLAEVLGVSRSHLCDVEKGRRRVSAERAARWAELLGYPAPLFVQLALQAELDTAGPGLTVRIAGA